jgi:hypothetical protein
MIEGKKINLRMVKEEEIPLFVSLANRIDMVRVVWTVWRLG